jgi:hypothetical protein
MMIEGLLIVLVQTVWVGSLPIFVISNINIRVDPLHMLLLATTSPIIMFTTTTIDRGKLEGPYFLLRIDHGLGKRQVRRIVSETFFQMFITFTVDERSREIG